MVWFLPVLMAGALSLSSTSFDAASATSAPTAAAFDALLTAPDRRVRTNDGRIQDLLGEGMRRSATFARLVCALNTTDVIVYVQVVDRLPSAVVGQLMLVPVTHQQRYLRIQVRGDLVPNELIALIGHELQHALEVASDPDVRDERTLTALYRRIGERSTGIHAFDTAAAQETGRQVRSELIAAAH